MTPPTKRRLTAVQMIFGLRKRIVKLERELNGAMHARTEDVRRSVMAGMQQFEEEHRARDIASLVHKEMLDVERRLLEQLRPHMVEVKVEYNGVYEPGDEFTVRA